MKTEKLSQKSPDFPDSFYRISVKGVYVKEGKVLMSHDFVNEWKNPGGKYELPGGGLDFGESFEEVLKREIKEEMGLEVTWVAAKPTYIMTARQENGRGMDWYYVLSICFQIDLKDINFTPSEECRAIKFFSKEELQHVLVASQLKDFVELFDPKDFEKADIRK